MAKRLFIVAQLLCWAAFFALCWFADHKMGVQRHLMAQNFYWPKAVPLVTLQWIGWSVFALLSTFVLFQRRALIPAVYSLFGLAALLSPSAYRPMAYNQGLCLLAVAWSFALINAAARQVKK